MIGLEVRGVYVESELEGGIREVDFLRNLCVKESLEGKLFWGVVFWRSLEFFFVVYDDGILFVEVGEGGGYGRRLGFEGRREG